MSSSSNRPAGVTVLGLLWIVWAVFLFTAAADMWHGRVGGYGYVVLQFPDRHLTERAPYVGVFGLVFLVVGFGLWAMQNWARILTLCCCFASLGIAALNLYPLIAFSGKRGRTFHLDITGANNG